MALAAPGASAAPFHPFLETFGSANQPSFSNSKGVAIYQATGDVYVMDDGSPPSIKRYHPDGTPADFSALGTNAIDGEGGADATPQPGLGFASPAESQVAIDNSGGATDGNIYVTQNSPNAINVFSPSGAYLGQLTAAGATPFSEACGVAVDPSGAVYVGDYNSGIHKFVPAANPPVDADYTATFTTTTQPCTLAAGAGPTAGFLFPAQYNGPISKIDSSTGELKYAFSDEVRTVFVDPSTGHVYAIKGSEFAEFDASGAASATQLSSDALSEEGRGISVRGSTGHVFVSLWESANLEVFGPLTIAPTVTIEPASGISATEATLNGTVDPEGVALTECKFEWGPTSGSGYPNSVPCEQSVPTDSNAHAVSADISGLAGGGSEYRFRLVAKNADAPATSDPAAFAVGALINGTAATVGTDEATLRGAINPGGETTSYKFEWGPTNAYGNTTETFNLSAGGEPVAVSALLDGLTPGATYHYRLVATNAVGTTQGPDRTFTTFASLPSLGPERAFELVSPYPTGGVPLVANAADVSVSEDGNRVHFGMAGQPFPGTDLVPPPDHLHGGRSNWRYGSLRGADGWHAEEYGLAQTGLSPLPSFVGAGVSADGSRYLFASRAGAEQDPRFDPDDQNGSLAPGSGSDVYQRQADGSLVWISRDPRIPVGTPQLDPGDAMPAGGLGMAEMSVDGSTVVFVSLHSLDDADTAASGFPYPPNYSVVSLYKWQEGELTFIGERPDGSVPSEGTRLGGLSAPALQGTVSRDGTRVLFSAQRTDSGVLRTNYTLYIQTDGQPTVEAVKETGVPPLSADQPYNVVYRGASGDLSRAFFTSNSRLTPDSGASATDGGATNEEGHHDLYVYDIGADKVRDLTPRIDGIDDPDVDPATADRGRARGLVANSEDGKRVYFVADAQYDVAPNPEGELPSPEGRNLYLAELDGIDDPIELRFVAALGPSDGHVWQEKLGSAGGLADKSAQASPDGSVLGFGSSEPLTGQALGGTEQLFVYDAEADTLKCASCPNDGSLPAGGVNLKAAEIGGGAPAWQTEFTYRRWVSSNGRVFFHARSQLVDGDTNLVDDVYEYRAGSLRLVSAGTGTLPSRLEDISRDGSTAIINTSDALLPEDEEPGISKLYAARVGGGFPLRPKPAACDLGAGACEKAGTSSPQQPGAGSAAFEGAGDPKPKKAAKRCPKGKRKVRRQGKVRCAPAKSHKHKRDAKNDRRASR